MCGSQSRLVRDLKYLIMTPYVTLPQSLKLFFSFNSGESILLQDTNLIPAMLSQYDNFSNCAFRLAQKALGDSH